MLVASVLLEPLMDAAVCQPEDNQPYLFMKTSPVTTPLFRQYLHDKFLSCPYKLDALNEFQMPISYLKNYYM